MRSVFGLELHISIENRISDIRKFTVTKDSEGFYKDYSNTYIFKIEDNYGLLIDPTNPVVYYNDRDVILYYKEKVLSKVLNKLLLKIGDLGFTTVKFNYLLRLIDMNNRYLDVDNLDYLPTSFVSRVITPILDRLLVDIRFIDKEKYIDFSTALLDKEDRYEKDIDINLIELERYIYTENNNGNNNFGNLVNVIYRIISDNKEITKTELRFKAEKLSKEFDLSKFFVRNNFSKAFKRLIKLNKVTETKIGNKKYIKLKEEK